MAEEQEQQPSNQAAAAFPAPPFFWQHFTPENVERIEQLRAAQSAKQDAATEPPSKLPPRILDLPTELRFLQPPDPPASGRYRSFGSAFTVCYHTPEGYHGTVIYCANSLIFLAADPRRVTFPRNSRIRSVIHTT
jgi:hypothetical protein